MAFRNWLFNGAMAFLAAALFVSGARGADLPPGTQAALKSLKLDPAILANVDRELKVPDDWLNRARKEPPPHVVGTWDPRQFKKIEAVFHARYPDIPINYSRGSRYDRAIGTLVALKEGRYIADVIVSFNRSFPEFKRLNALVDLRQLPAFSGLADKMRDDDGLWVGSKLTRRCLGYNTDRVTNKDDLPKTWDDILTNPRWGNGHLAVINSVTTWMLQLWDANGEQWAKNFLTRLHDDVKAQLRKEGENASLKLVGAGEYDGILVASEYRSHELQKKGAPVGFHCPSPVPVAVSPMGVLRGGPGQYAAMIFVNWTISKEGQIVNFAASGQVPTHKGLQGREFLFFPEEFEGKPSAFPAALDDENQEKLEKYWASLWGQAK